jgi:hypothetical protein
MKKVCVLSSTTVVVLCVLVFIAALLGTSITNVPLYTIGIFYNRINAEFGLNFGDQGLNTHNPAMSVIFLNTSQYSIVFNNGVTTGINCLSNDGVSILNLDVIIFYQYDISNETRIINLYKKFGDFNSVNQFIYAMAKYAANDVCSRYNTEDFILIRDIISNDFGSAFAQVMKDTDIPINLGTVGLRDYQYPPAYANATDIKQQSFLQIYNYETQRQTNISAANNIYVNAQLQANINMTVAQIQANATLVAAESNAEAIKEAYIQFGNALNDTMYALGMQNKPDQFIDSYLINYPLIKQINSSTPLIVSMT